MAYQSVDEIRRKNIGAGYHFFDAGTLKSFGSRIYDDLFAGRIFLTSEQDRGPHPYGSRGAWDGVRRYTVRIARDDGSIGELSEFGEFESLANARRHARTMADATPAGLIDQAAALLSQAAELVDLTGVEDSDGTPAATLRRLHWSAYDVSRAIKKAGE